MGMIEETLTQRLRETEEGFRLYLPEETGYQETVLQAVNYSLQAGGKRLRPLFMYGMYRILGGTDEPAVRPFMMAMEMIHTYSLVHDDLPAMDNDDYRRGKLTTHKKYGEDMGILAGDALLNLAYETAFRAFDSRTDSRRIASALRILGHKAGIYGMVGGQAVDVENNGRFVDEATLFYVYKNKTAALIEGSLMIGAVLAGASEEQLDTAESIGTDIGIAFQIQDDILDVAGDEQKIGKPVHSDEKNQKSTFVAMRGLEESRQRVREYTDRALDRLDHMETTEPEEKNFLRGLMESLVNREM
ncbi:MAG: polyprenyl synthetase family protein [Eubacterium sp.]|nr:polyprenyl synthetase family protein [Eubacterium sp.]